jgi:NifU-like protein
LIEEVLEKEIRPALKMDGGDIELIDIDHNQVFVALRGKCTACPSSGYTREKYIEGKLRELVSKDIVVVEVKS